MNNNWISEWVFKVLVAHIKWERVAFIFKVFVTHENFSSPRFKEVKFGFTKVKVFVFLEIHVIIIILLFLNQLSLVSISLIIFTFLRMNFMNDTSRLS